MTIMRAIAEKLDALRLWLRVFGACECACRVPLVL